jgi:hypothetical protein
LSVADVTTGVLPAANGGTGIANTGTLTNATATTITGGGTFALGGFTLTVPATGTAVLTTASQTISGNNTISGSNIYGNNVITAGGSGTTNTLAGSTLVVGALSSYDATRALAEFYGTANTGAAYPFLESGNLILQSRISGANRDLLLSTVSGVFGFTLDRNDKCWIGPGTGTGNQTAPSANSFSGNIIWGRNTAAADTAGAAGEGKFGTPTTTYTNYATTATYQQVDTVSLTAGKWHIYGHGTFSSNSATLTVSTNNIWVISTVTASATGAVEGSGNIIYIPEAVLTGLAQKESGMLDMVVNINATTSYFLNSQATFTLGSPQFVGSLEADRMP